MTELVVCATCKHYRPPYYRTQRLGTCTAIDSDYELDTIAVIDGSAKNAFLAVSPAFSCSLHSPKKE